MIEVIQILKDQDSFASQVTGQTQGYHGLFASHPKNDKRLHDAVQRSAYALPEELSDYEGDFWEMLDGLVYGNQAAAGIVKGRAYYHGNLRFVVEFPEGWDVGATSNRITGKHPAGSSAGTITLERQNAPKEEQTPEQYVADTLKRAEDVVSGESFTVSGFDAYLASLNVDDGKYTARLIGIIYKDGGVYMFKGDSREGEDPEQFMKDVRATMETFRAMSAADLRTANDQRIRVIDAQPGDSYASLAKKTSIRRFPEENLRLLNGDHPVGEPRAGDRIKIVQ
jgi:predicted Zn-dependent protease